MNNEIHIKIEEPSNRRFRCFDVVISTYGVSRRFHNVRADFTWFDRLWHRVIGWFGR